MNKIKINIFSPGRFHVCDLARELDKNGFDVKFYSFVSTKRAEKFGLPRRCSFSLLIPMAPFLALERVLFKRSGWAKRLSISVQDWLSSVVMRKCDICIAMSGNYILTPKKAKKQGALVIIERGSKHIVEQKAILDACIEFINAVNSLSIGGLTYAEKSHGSVMGMPKQRNETAGTPPASVARTSAAEISASAPMP